MGEETLSRVLFFEDGNMEQIGIFELDHLEQAISCCTCVFDPTFGTNTAAAETGSAASTSSPAGRSGQWHQPAPTGTEYFVVGSAHVVSGELEPTRGRILVFEIVENRRVHLIAEKEVKGAVFSLASVCGRLVAGIGSKVRRSCLRLFSLCG